MWVKYERLMPNRPKSKLRLEMEKLQVNEGLELDKNEAKNANIIGAIGINIGRKNGAKFSIKTLLNGYAVLRIN